MTILVGYAVSTFLFMTLHPILMFVRFGHRYSIAKPLIKNDLASHLFLLFVFPFAVGLFADSVHFNKVWYLGSKAAGCSAIGLLILVEALAAWFVAQDIGTPGRFLSPGVIGDDKKSLAAAIFHNAKTLELAESIGPNQNASNDEWQTRVASVQQAYKEQISCLYDKEQRLLWRQGSVTLYSEYVFTYLSVGFAFLYFWYLGLVLWARAAASSRVASRASIPPDTQDGLILVLCLLILFFPARLYTEWYLAFFSLKFFRSYYGFWILFVLALFALVLLVFVIKPQSATVANIVTVEGVFAVAGAFVGYVRPKWLREIGRSFLNAPPEWIAALGILLVLFLSFLTASVHPAGVAPGPG